MPIQPETSELLRKFANNWQLPYGSTKPTKPIRSRESSERSARLRSPDRGSTKRIRAARRLSRTTPVRCESSLFDLYKFMNVPRIFPNRTLQLGQEECIIFLVIIESSWIWYKADELPRRSVDSILVLRLFPPEVQIQPMNCDKIERQNIGMAMSVEKHRMGGKTASPYSPEDVYTRECSSIGWRSTLQ